jgi:hypothetical protein
MPGVNWLAEKDADPVRLAVISAIRTIMGVHATREFQEVEVAARTRGIGTDDKTAENARRIMRAPKTRVRGNFMLSLRELLARKILRTKF